MDNNVENSIIEQNIQDNSIEDEQIIQETQLSSTYDYYDWYQNEVLSRLDTIISKNNDILNYTRNVSSFTFCSLFVMCLILIYIFIRNMISVK